MASASSHAAHHAPRGRIIIYVIGFAQAHWSNFPHDLYRQMYNAIVDVREWLPRDPKGQGKGKKGKGKNAPREPLVDDVVGMDGFVDATTEVVRVCLEHGRAIVGSCKNTTSLFKCVAMSKLTHSPSKLPNRRHITGAPASCSHGLTLRSNRNAIATHSNEAVCEAQTVNLNSRADVNARSQSDAMPCHRFCLTSKHRQW